MKSSNIPNLEGYGVFVDDIDFKHLTRPQWMTLGKLQMEKLVMIIRNSGITVDRFHQLMKLWEKRDRTMLPSKITRVK